ncbi:hypothetical protein EJ02DRAFT_394292 [Clathrospora elynae]|uniref:Transposase IS30-like HTH domain-containing protein n=1 Tax=Clathrospora elynae TaxID=706981 RepID=A0A6A5TC87_9PLEO|nr:hypothetical protein EJ02DRAFT_394292 [Clathrospora elynae]
MSPPSTPRRHTYLTRNERLQVQILCLAGHSHKSIADLLEISERQVCYVIHCTAYASLLRSEPVLNDASAVPK